MQNKPKVFIIAGEVSGDVLGARIMAQMPDVEFFGIGGENMKAAGLQTLFPMADLSVMGRGRGCCTRAYVNAAYS